MNNFSQKNIKTFHVTTVDITGRFIILGFLKFLMQQGYDVKLICSFDRHKQFIEQAGVPIKHIAMTRRITPIEDIISFWNLFWYFVKEKPDIVHTYTPKAGILGRVAARLAGVPVVIHTSYGFYIGQKLPWRIRTAILLAEKVAAWFCDLLISQNQEDIDMAVSQHIVRPEKIIKLTYGIDLARYNPEKFSADQIEKKKQQLGISGKRVIGMVGRFVQEKGYVDLFKAFAIVEQHVPEAVLLLVAPKDREKHDALDILVLQQYGIAGKTVVLGHEQEISDIETIYPLMDVFVLPSYREGFPYSIMEVSAMAKPVVATNIRGCKEAVEDGVTGLLVPLANPEALANALISLLQNPEKMRQLGVNGRQKALREFDQQEVFAKIADQYNRLLKK